MSAYLGESAQEETPGPGRRGSVRRARPRVNPVPSCASSRPPFALSSSPLGLSLSACTYPCRIYPQTAGRHSFRAYKLWQSGRLGATTGPPRPSAFFIASLPLPACLLSRSVLLRITMVCGYFLVRFWHSILTFRARPTRQNRSRWITSLILACFTLLFTSASARYENGMINIGLLTLYVTILWLVSEGAVADPRFRTVSIPATPSLYPGALQTTPGLLASNPRRLSKPIHFGLIK